MKKKHTGKVREFCQSGKVGTLQEGGVSACQGGVSGRHPPVDRILETRLRKHYLSATSFADGN